MCMATKAWGTHSGEMGGRGRSASTDWDDNSDGHSEHSSSLKSISDPSNIIAVRIYVRVGIWDIQRKVARSVVA